MGLAEKIKRFFKIGDSVDLGELLAAGAKVIDVRSPGEFAGGHLKGALNIPLNMLHDKKRKILVLILYLPFYDQALLILLNI